MNYLKRKLGIVGSVVALSLLAGCLLSGTFISVIVIVDEDFTTRTGFYFYDVDLTEEDVWNDHKDEIKDIDLVGFELWITNHESEERKFSVYLDDADEPVYDTLPDVLANTTIVLDDLTLTAGPDVQTHVTYGQSFKYLKNVPTLLELVKKGAFHYYGISDGGTSAGYTIDSAKVVITFTAGT